MFKRHLTAALVFGMAATAPPALAAGIQCAARDNVTENLAVKYEEEQAGIGLQSQDRLVEIWASPETGSWTLLMTQADGTTCVLATGHNWHTKSAEELLAQKGEPS